MGRRDSDIIDFVKKNRFATPAQLAELLHVSPVTIRRDIDRLDRENILCKVHGGVIFQKPDEPKTVGFRSELNRKEKIRLASFIASRIVTPGDKIFLDAGSTTMFIARELAAVENLTIITHSLSIIDLVKDHDNIDLIAVGGEYDRSLQAFLGPLVEEGYQSLMADKAFIGANAIHLGMGCYDNTGSEKHIKRLINSNAEKSYMVLDSSKFHNKSGLFQSLRMSEISSIITTLDKCDPILNAGLPEEIELIFVT
jgi:DeoR/GlpR family transcriptional regulator of sugar metabolism